MARMSDMAYFWWVTKARVRHLFLRHTLIAVEVWTKNTVGETVVTRHGWKCWICPYQEP